MSRTRRPTQRRNARPGFTLIEAAFTTVIIGVGVVAMVDAQQAFVRSNNWSNESSTAAFLASEIREMTRLLPRHDPVTGLFLSGGSLVGWGPEDGEVLVTDFDDIDDFDGLSFSWVGTADPSDGDLQGPINAYGEVIPAIDADGVVIIALDDDGAPMVDANGDDLLESMQGWSQVVTVEKVRPHDNIPAIPIEDDAVEAPLGVDDFPLRVTVTVTYQNPEIDPAPRDVTSLSWIVP
ncbi:MAG: hypothetical protein AAGB51_02135 [Planctomycetota bacterium]